MDEMEVGRQAEEFLTYINEKPYFNEMIDRIRLGLMTDMAALRPSQSEEWKSLSERFHFLPEIVNMARGDVYVASVALEAMSSGKTRTEGIL